MHQLRCIHSELGEAEQNPASPNKLSVEFSRSAGFFSAEFSVIASAPFQVDKNLDKMHSHWGLWEKDVVELFFSPQKSGLPYYELQLSPLGQFFELKVLEPRKKTEKTLEFEWKRQVLSIGDRSFTAKMEVPLAALGITSELQPLYGNAFAILGPPASKTYWSLFLPPQTKPDFHLPEYFQKLEGLSNA